MTFFSSYFDGRTRVKEYPFPLPALDKTVSLPGCQQEVWAPLAIDMPTLQAHMLKVASEST